MNSVDIARIRNLFDRQIEQGFHHGGQLSVYSDGEEVLSLAGGTAGEGRESVSADTRFLLFSCSKPYVAVGIHKLVEDDVVAYDDPIADHWPGFAERGQGAKAAVTIRHVLSHRGGFPVSSLDATPQHWPDWDRVVEAMETVDLTYNPGSTFAYHSQCYGWVLGELINRITGRPVREFLADAVFEPIDLTATTLGLDPGMPDEVADLWQADPPDRCRQPDTGLDRPFDVDIVGLFDSERFHRATIPSGNVIGTASDISRFYMALADGGEIDGDRLLEPATVSTATAAEVETERDEVTGTSRRYGLGFELGGTAWDKFGATTTPETFGHAGFGSSVGWADPEARLSIACVFNGVRDEFEHALRVNTLGDAVRAVFG